jgi:hypothetical protein
MSEVHLKKLKSNETYIFELDQSRHTQDCVCLSVCEQRLTPEKSLPQFIVFFCEILSAFHDLHIFAAKFYCPHVNNENREA